MPKHPRSDTWAIFEHHRPIASISYDLISFKEIGKVGEKFKPTLNSNIEMSLKRTKRGQKGGWFLDKLIASRCGNMSSKIATKAYDVDRWNRNYLRGFLLLQFWTKVIPTSQRDDFAATLSRSVSFSKYVWQWYYRGETERERGVRVYRPCNFLEITRYFSIPTWWRYDTMAGSISPLMSRLMHYRWRRWRYAAPTTRIRQKIRDTHFAPLEFLIFLFFLFALIDDTFFEEFFVKFLAYYFHFIFTSIAAITYYGILRFTFFPEFLVICFIYFIRTYLLQNSCKIY